MGRFLRSCVPWGVLGACALACSACRCDAGEPGRERATRSPDPPDSLPAQAAKPAAPAEPPKPAAPAEASEQLPRPELLDRILRSDLVELTPDQAGARFAPLAFERETPMPRSVLLTARSEELSLRVGFRQASDDAPMRFAYLRLNLFSDSGSEAQALYEELALAARDRLGQPAWTKDDAPYLARGFKLGTEFDVNVGALMNRDEGRPYAAIVIEQPPEQPAPQSGSK